MRACNRVFRILYTLPLSLSPFISPPSVLAQLALTLCIHPIVKNSRDGDASVLLAGAVATAIGVVFGKQHRCSTRLVVAAVVVGVVVVVVVVVMVVVDVVVVVVVVEVVAVVVVLVQS